MPESNIGFASQIWEIVRYPFAALIGLITWIMTRQVKRVDVLEKETVTTETLNETVKALRNDIHSVSDDVKGVHTRLDNFIDRR